MQVGYENFVIFDQYLASSHVVDAATVYYQLNYRRTVASW